MTESTEHRERIENQELTSREQVPSEIERVVMQRVHLIRALRYAVSSGTLSLLLSFGALWGISRYVWVARILENAPHDPLKLPHFYLAAFDHANLLVQSLTVLMVVCFGVILYEIYKAITVLSDSKPQF